MRGTGYDSPVAKFLLYLHVFGEVTFVCVDVDGKNRSTQCAKLADFSAVGAELDLIDALCEKCAVLSLLKQVAFGVSFSWNMPRPRDGL